MIWANDTMNRPSALNWDQFLQYGVAYPSSVARPAEPPSAPPQVSNAPHVADDLPPPGPFLKWPGGKRWLVARHSYVFPSTYNRYIEPFLGAGSVYFHLRPAEAVLGDLNKELVSTYEGIREDHQGVQDLLDKHQMEHGNDYYYYVRQRTPVSLTERAARMIYLNRTCFNGIYRVNRRGEFNVPIGSRTTVNSNSDDFARVANLLTTASLRAEDFEVLVNEANQNDLVFLDPPYTVRHNKNGFVKYNEHLFSWEDQKRLAKAATRAAERGAHVVATNADHQEIRQLYSEDVFDHQLVSRFSPISASSENRAQYGELIITTKVSKENQ